MIELKYNKEENIIYSNRTGEVTLENLLESMKRVVADFKDKKCLYILGDIRGSISRFNDSDFEVILIAVKDMVKGKDEVRHAILVESRTDTAYSLLYERFSNSLINYEVKTFSTPEAARVWLQQGFYYSLKK